MPHTVTLTWISGELGVPERTLRNWMSKDPAIPRPGRGKSSYPSSVLPRLRAIQDGLQRWPQGPITCILDQFDRERDDED